MDTLEAKFRVRVEGKEELESFFAGGERGARSMQAAVKGALADTAKSIGGFVSGLAKDLERVSGLKFGLAGNARAALEFRDSLQRLAIMAQIGDDQIAGIKKQILDVATASNQAAPAIEGALSAFVEKTGDIDTARKNLALYAQTATATAASIEDVAQVGVQLSQKLNVKDQANSFAILAVQAKKGAIELRDLATYAPKIFSVGASMGLEGEKGVREAGALAQVYAQAFGGRGSGAQTATAIENTFKDIANKHVKFEQLGIKVQGRDPMDAIFDLIRKTGGDPFKIADTGIFDIRAMRGIRILANEYRQTGGFGTYESFRDVAPNAGLIASDAARAQSTGIAALQRSQNAIFRASDENLGDTADFLAQHSGLAAQAYGFATAHPLLAGSGAAGGLLLGGIAKRALLGGGGGGAGGGGLLGKLLPGGGDAMPVKVTNWPGSFGSGPGGSGGGLPAGALPGAAGIVAGGAVVTAVGLAATALHDKALDSVSKGVMDQHARDVADLKAGRKRYVKHWYNFGGASLVDVPTGQQAQAAAEYARQTNNIKIEINGDKATVSDSKGTRSTAVMVKRNGGE